jgi:hypothetical protein
MNRPIIREQQDARQEQQRREVDAAIKSVGTGSVTIHVSDGKIRHVDVTTRRKVDGG